MDQLRALSVDASERFTLASRWLRRAGDSANSIDKILFYYTVLEIYPTLGTADVPNRVCDFLIERLYPTRDRTTLKAKLNLGRICGFRADIVHKGKSVMLASEASVVIDHVARLRAISRTCLRLLASLPVGTDLDEFVLRPTP